MTYEEVEIVANAGVQLREIAERLTVAPGLAIHNISVVEFVRRMDSCALSISEVYGQLSALPLETEPPATWTCPKCGCLSSGYRFPESHHSWCPVVTEGESVA